MTNEVLEQEAPVTEAPEQPSVDGRAGFDAVMGKTPEPVATPTAAAEPPPASIEPETPPATEATPPPEPVNPFAGFTKDQADALLAKVARIDELGTELRKAHGKIGSLSQQVAELKAKPAEPPPVAQPALPDVDDAEFVEQYPEFASFVQKALKGVQAAGEKAGLSPEEVDARIAAKEAELVDRFERERLDDAHPGWSELIGQTPYKAWLVTQPEDVQTTATTTTSAKALGKIISDFKQFSAPKPNRNKSRLDEAVTPAGVPQRGAPTLSPTDEGRAGFNAVRGR